MSQGTPQTYTEKIPRTATHTVSVSKEKHKPKAAPNTRVVKRGKDVSRGNAAVTGYRVVEMRVLITGYSAPCPIQGTGLHTATGRRVQQAVGSKVVKIPGCAVDPKIIPLGSLIKINGKLYPADDTGGAIKGRRIDLRLNSRNEAILWGKRWMVVKVFIKE